MALLPCFLTPLRAIPPCLPTVLAGEHCTGHAPELHFSRDQGSRAVVLIQPAQEHTEPLACQGHGHTNHKSFLLAKGKSLEQRKHLQLWSVFRPLCKGRADPSWISTAASSSSLRSALPREGNSPRALGSVF